MMKDVIECSDRLPEINKTVLVWSLLDWEFGRINSLGFMEVYFEGCWQELDFTYWAELPEYPEKPDE